MDAVTWSLILAGAFLHALWNMLSKRVANTTGGGLSFVWLCGLVSVGWSLPLAIILQRTSVTAWGAAAWACVLASAWIHVGYGLALQRGYQRGDFAVVYPVARGVGPLFAVLGAALFLQEWPSAGGWLGVLSITLGLAVLARPVSKIASDAKSATSQVSRHQGWLWGVITGLTIAAYTVVDGWAIRRLQMEPLTFYACSLLIRNTTLAPIALRSALQRAQVVMRWQQAKWAILFVGVCSPVAYFLILFALQRAPLSMVAPLRELGMLLGVWIGALCLGERLTWARAFGSTAMLLGAYLIAST